VLNDGCIAVSLETSAPSVCPKRVPIYICRQFWRFMRL